KLGKYAFANCSKLSAVTVKKKAPITAIPSQCFAYCTKLSVFTIPSKVTSIGSRAFLEDYELDITIPDKVKNIGKNAFDGTAVQTVEVSAQNIGENAFIRCYSLTNVVLKPGVKKVKSNAFSFGGQIEKFTIGSTVKDIAQDAISNSEINEFQVDPANTEYTVKDGALYSGDMKTLMAYPAPVYEESEETETEGLAQDVGADPTAAQTQEAEETTIKTNKAIVPEGVETIGGNAFRFSSLTEVQLPSTLKTIENGAFSNNNLSTVQLPASLTTIGESAFEGNAYLTDISVGDSVESIGNKAFANCVALKEAALGKGIKIIPKELFAGDGELTSVKIPDTVKMIEPGAFRGCMGLGSDYNDKLKLDDSPNFKVDKKGALLSENGKTLIAYPGEFKDSVYIENEDGMALTDMYDVLVNSTDQGETYTVDSAVKTVRSGAFSYSPDVSVLKVKSKSTKLEDNSYGLSYATDSSNTEPVIIGKSGSGAQKYADTNDIAFFTGDFAQNVTKKSLKAGKSFKFKISNTPAGKTFFSSTNPNVAKVLKSGKVVAVAKGKTDIYATVGTKNFCCKVTVTTGKKAGVYKAIKGYSDVDPVNADKLAKWSRDYYKLNESLFHNNEIMPAINFYSGNSYTLVNGGFYDKSDSYFKYIFGPLDGDYGQYLKIGENLHKELSMTAVNTNLITYRGTDYIAMYTGAGNSIADMKASIGKTVRPVAAHSTSLSPDVALAFAGDDRYATVLEFYTPKGSKVGTYLSKVSTFSTEEEYLINSNLKLKVLDAGVHTINTRLWNYEKGKSTTVPVARRYMRLLVME
nr:leucine-rich repeat protein [Lachnospiraceae bacterium]